MRKVWLFSLFALGCAVVSAQNPLACKSQAAHPAIRSEGVAELVGDILITCTNGVTTAVGTPIPGIDVTVGLNVPVGSRTFGTSGLSEALLVVDDAFPASTAPLSVGAPPYAGKPQNLCLATAAGSCVINGTGKVTGAAGGDYDGNAGHFNVFQGVVSGVNRITFYGVPIDPPGAGNVLRLRITNVRADAAALAPSSTPQPIDVFLSMGSVSVTPNTLLGGLSTPGVMTTVSPVTGTPGSTPLNLSVTFQEGSKNAFRVRSFMLGSASQNIPGYLYNTESGLWDNLTPPAGLSPVGLADSGTRLFIRFTGFPAGGKIIVPTVVPLKGGNGKNYVSYIATDANGDALTPPPPPPQSNTVMLTLDSAGSAFAAFEVQSADASNYEGTTIPILIYATQMGSVTPSLAPLASGKIVIPRFVAP